MRAPNFLAAVVLLTATIAGCNSSDGPSTPTAPTTPTTPAPVATSLSGTVTSSTGGPVPGASVTITDGSNAGRSTSTSATGTYRFDSLTASNGNVFARANGFDDDGRGAFISSATTLNFTLRAIFFNVAGSGNRAFDLPTRSTRALITGQWNGRNFGTNFIVWIGGRLVVNEILDGRSRSYSGTHAIVGGAVEIRSSTDVDPWRIQEVQ